MQRAPHVKAVSDGDLRLVSCLIVAQPRELEERQVYEINRAVSANVPTIFLVSRFSLDASTEGIARGLPLSKLKSGLEDLLRSWGVELGQDILASNESGTLPINGAAQHSATRLAIVVAPKAVSLDTEHPLTHNLDQLAFPAASGLKLSRETLHKNRITVTELARTPTQTWSVKGQSFEQALSREDLVEPKDPEKFRGFIDPLPLAVLLQGHLPFLYKDKPVPGWSAKKRRGGDK